MTAEQTLAGEVAVVTGGAGGIGTAVCRALAGAGARVAVADLDGDGADAVAGSLGDRHFGMAIDVGSRESVRAGVATVRERLGVPTILVCAAGVVRVVPAVDLDPADWDLILGVNLGGTFQCCQAFGGAMVQAGRGVIVNVASISGVVTGGAGRVAYGASKGGVAGLTRALAVEWAPFGVRVNAIAPGLTVTPMVQALSDAGNLDLEALAATIPAGRIATPQDVAGVVVTLASPVSDYIVGQMVVVDGGLTTQGPRVVAVGGDGAS